MKGISGGTGGLSANNVWGKRGDSGSFILDNRCTEKRKTTTGVSPDFIIFGFFSWNT